MGVMVVLGGCGGWEGCVRSVRGVGGVVVMILLGSWWGTGWVIKTVGRYVG